MSTFRNFGKRITHLTSFAVNKLSKGNSVVGRIVSGIVRATSRPVGLIIRRPPPTMAQRQILSQAFRSSIGRSGGSAWRGGWFNRMVGSGVRSAGRFTNIRAFSLGPWLRGGARNQNFTHHRLSLSAALAGFAYTAKADPGFLEQVRDLFEKHCRVRTAAELPKSLDGYDIGYWIAQGCNGVIYEARVRGEPDRSSTAAESEPHAQSVELGSQSAANVDDTAVSTISPALTDAEYMRWLHRKKLYPLAIKLCFNLEFTSNIDRILRTTGRERELVPATSKDIQGLLKWSRPLPESHPNIVDLKTAFIDDVRPLPLAEEKWGAALSLASGGQTLYIVMKRYSMTLRQYILLHKYTYRTARLLLGQLLEALAYLAACRIAHRDMKSNNILVDFDQLDEPPRLVLADFGSCLSQDDMKLPYPREGVDLGGNYALRAPEVVCVTPGPSSYIDYTKADLWAAGTLAYEICTRDNPFYYPPPHGLSNVTYTEDDLKPLPTAVPTCVQRLVNHLLKRDPTKRPTASVAASVVALSLFRLEFMRDFLNKSNIFKAPINGDMMENILSWRCALRDVAGLYAAETILASCQIKGELAEMSDRWRLSRAEEQLRMTFLRRLHATTLMEALYYFNDTEM